MRDVTITVRVRGVRQTQVALGVLRILARLGLLSKERALLGAKWAAMRFIQVQAGQGEWKRLRDNHA